MRRILLDFRLTAEDAQARLRKQIPDLKPEEFAAWDEAGLLAAARAARDVARETGPSGQAVRLVAVDTGPHPRPTRPAELAPVEERAALLERVNGAARSMGPLIRQVTTRFMDSVQRVIIASSGGVLAGDAVERGRLAQQAGQQLVSTEDARTTLRARIGTVEAQIEAARTRNSAEETSLGILRSDLGSVDPYEAATRLQTVQSQLESLYLVTARVSRLSLTEYLR